MNAEWQPESSSELAGRILGFEPPEQDCLLIVTVPGSGDNWEASQETAKSLEISHPAICSPASS